MASSTTGLDARALTSYGPAASGIAPASVEAGVARIPGRAGSS